MTNIFITEYLVSCFLTPGIPECGKNDLETDTFVSGSINDPEKNPAGTWPWMASLGFVHEEKSWNHRCGATLISDQHFLTAAHCIREK